MNTAENNVLTPSHTVRQLLAFFQPPGELVSDYWVSFSLQVLSHSARWAVVAETDRLPCPSFSVLCVSFSFSVI